jgi:hypothetical protein
MDSRLDLILKDNVHSCSEIARRAVAGFKLAYGARFGKAVAKITDGVDELLAFYDHPAEHWIQLRTTNPIESTFATVRHRSKITKGPGSKAAGLAMAFKLIEAAQTRWRARRPNCLAVRSAHASCARSEDPSGRGCSAMLERSIRRVLTIAPRNELKLLRVTDFQGHPGAMWSRVGMSGTVDKSYDAPLERADCTVANFCRNGSDSRRYLQE